MRISDWSSDVCSSDLVGYDGAVADIGVYLHQEIAPDRHGLGFRVVDVVGDDGTAACDFIPDKFGRDIIRDGSAPVLPVAGIFFQAFTPQILSLGDIIHFRRDDAAPRIMHLADVHAGLGATWALDDLWEGRDSGRSEERRDGKGGVG